MIIEHDSSTELKIPDGKAAIFFHLPGHCAGCKVALKILEGKKLEDTTVILIDAGDEANRPIIERFQAQTAPTMIVFYNKEILGRTAGVKEFTQKQQELLGD